MPGLETPGPVGFHHWKWMLVQVELVQHIGTLVCKVDCRVG